MRRAIAAQAALALAAATPIAAQSTLTVGPGQTLTEADFFAGSFMGQPFTLGPDLTIRLDGGTLAQVGSLNLVGDTGFTISPLSFNQTTIEITNNGSVATGEDVTDIASLPLIESWPAFTNTTLRLLPGSHLNGNLMIVGPLSASATDGATLVVEGGLFLPTTDLTFLDADLVVAAGRIAPGLDVTRADLIEIQGDHFQRNGAPTTVLAGLAQGDVFTAVLSDGSPLILTGTATPTTRADSVEAAVGIITTTPVPPGGTVIDQPAGEVPRNGLIPGDTLNAGPNASTREVFTLIGATLNANGAAIGSFTESAFSAINCNACSIGENLRLLQDDTLHLTDGADVAPNLYAGRGAAVTLESGSISAGATFEESILSIAGGSTQDLTLDNAQLFITGGEPAGPINADNGSQITLTARAAFLDGQPLHLPPVGSLILEEREGQTLDVVLEDNRPLTLTLNQNPAPGEDAFPDATIRIFETTEPNPCTADTDFDNAVDVNDLLTVLANFGSTTTLGPTAGDVNYTAEVEVTDLLRVLAFFGTTCP